MKKTEEPTVEELTFEPSALDAEQSAAWREVAREAVRGGIQLGKLYLFYLFLRFLFDVLVFLL